MKVWNILNREDFTEEKQKHIEEVADEIDVIMSKLTISEIGTLVFGTEEYFKKLLFAKYMVIYGEYEKVMVS